MATMKAGRTGKGKGRTRRPFRFWSWSSWIRWTGSVGLDQLDGPVHTQLLPHHLPAIVVLRHFHSMLPAWVIAEKIRMSPLILVLASRGEVLLKVAWIVPTVVPTFTRLT